MKWRQWVNSALADKYRSGNNNPHMISQFSVAFSQTVFISNNQAPSLTRYLLLEQNLLKKATIIGSNKLQKPLFT